ncbi:MAG: hypothetical protein JO199_13460 [Candidatus Eremiobacteraeota bacterium]|nr:hypothetical protein [Candidatus Eremiobacteraeota bacterium]
MSGKVVGTVGYAAGHRGTGVAYLRAFTASGEQLARVPFKVTRPPAGGNAAGYAAMLAVLRALRSWGVRRVDLTVEDRGLVDELCGRGDVAPDMVLPHVRVRCALNAFDAASVTLGAESDLTQRARAEAALSDAA